MVAFAAIAPYLISAAGSVLAAKAGQSKTDNTALERGIQMRVADAKEAGIHPLYALGANIPSPTIVPQTGSGVGEALQMGAQTYQRKQAEARRQEAIAPVQAAQIKSMEGSAARDNAAAALSIEELSVIKRGQQAQNAQPTIKNPVFPGGDFDMEAGIFANKEDWEKAYGDDVSDMVMIMKFGNDLINKYSTNPWLTKEILKTLTGIRRGERVQAGVKWLQRLQKKLHKKYSKETARTSPYAAYP